MPTPLAQPQPDRTTARKGVVRFAKSVEAVNLVFGFLVATGFDEHLHGGDELAKDLHASFGLPESLDASSPLHSALLFVIGMSVVTRYTLGCANHLHLEYSKNPQLATYPGDLQVVRKALRSDILFLLAYGLIARISGAWKSPCWFFLWMAILFALSVCWGKRAATRTEWRNADWSFWQGLNKTSFLCAAFGCIASWFFPRTDWWPNLLVTGVACMVFLILCSRDLWFQLSLVSRSYGTSPGQQA